MTRSVPPLPVVLRNARGQTVIPIEYIGRASGGQKKARVRWKHLQSGWTDTDDVNAWHATWPESMWAVVTGRASGVFTLDFDGEPGRQTLQDLGLTPHRRTPSGGFHVDVELPDFVVRSATCKSDKALGAAFPGLDLRGEGGLAVFYGATPLGRYEQLRPIDPDPFDVVPGHLIPFLPRRRAKTSPTSSGRRTVLGLERMRPVAWHHGTSTALAIEAVERVTAGAGRNDTGFWLACQCRDHGFTAEEARLTVLTFQQAMTSISGSPS